MLYILLCVISFIYKINKNKLLNTVFHPEQSSANNIFVDFSYIILEFHQKCVYIDIKLRERARGSGTGQSMNSVFTDIT